MTGGSRAVPGWDVFLSHAREDRDEVARPLAEALRARGVTVWLDESALEVGDRVLKTIHDALLRSRYGVFVVSEWSLAKSWPQRELESFLARETPEDPIVLPIVHGFDLSELARRAPLLAGSVALSTERGIDGMADAIASRIHGSDPPPHAGEPRRQPPRAARPPLRLGVIAAVPLIVVAIGRTIYLLIGNEHYASSPAQWMPVASVIGLGALLNGWLTRMLLPSMQHRPRSLVGASIGLSILSFALTALLVGGLVHWLCPELV